MPCPREATRFLRRHHHLLAADVLTRAELCVPGDSVPNASLRSHEWKPLVAQVCTLQNEWHLASAPLLNVPCENPFGEPLTDAGPIRVAILAAFLRLVLLLDANHRSLDITELAEADVPAETRARHWKRHFVKTCRLEADGARM